MENFGCALRNDRLWRAREVSRERHTMPPFLPNPCQRKHIIMMAMAVLLSIVTGRTAAQTLPSAPDAAGASATRTSQMQERIVPEIPAVGKRMRLLIDSDAANEIDDLYAIGLAVRSPERFSIEGIVATQFSHDGLSTVQQSYHVIHDLLTADNRWGAFRVEKGGKPLQSMTEPEDSAGARLIIERAKAGDKSDPLWVVGIGAASNIASALMLDPSIRDRIRLVFHARCEEHWPKYTTQFNIKGDVAAARFLLASGVPLVWFDTGAQLVCPMDETKRQLSPLGGMPAFLHDYRSRRKDFQSPKKGFFDLGDIAFLMQPDVCTVETVDVPHLGEDLKFERLGDLGKMLRVHSIRPEPAWKLFFEQMAKRPDSADMARDHSIPAASTKPSAP